MFSNSSWPDEAEPPPLLDPDLDEAEEAELVDRALLVNLGAGRLVPPSALGTTLLQRWGWGRMPAELVQELCHAAVLDGAQAPEVDFLAGIGAFGQSKANCHRDLLRAYAHDVQCPPVWGVRVPCLDKKLDATDIVYESAGVLLPHDWIFHLSHYYASDFERIFGINEVSSFWAKQSRHL